MVRCSPAAIAWSVWSSALAPEEPLTSRKPFKLISDAVERDLQSIGARAR